MRGRRRRGCGRLKLFSWRRALSTFIRACLLHPPTWNPTCLSPIQYVIPENPVRRIISHRYLSGALLQFNRDKDMGIPSLYIKPRKHHPSIYTYAVVTNPDTCTRSRQAVHSRIHVVQLGTDAAQGTPRVQATYAFQSAEAARELAT